MPNRPTRRTVLTATVSALALGLAGGPALALTTDEARALIDRLVADINAVINSGKPEKQMYKEFERIFNTYGDVPIIARKALGPDWRRATPAQRAAFTKAFSGYMSRKYGARFREFIGGKIEVTAARPVKSFFEVISVAKLQGEAPFEVRWLVSDKSGQTKMFNLFIEGINMLKAEATEIGAMLDKRGGNIDKMIQDLQRAG